MRYAMRGRARVAGTMAAALLTLGVAACGDDAEEPAPTAWSTTDATNTSDQGGERVQDDAYKVVKGNTWDDLRLPASGKSAMVDPKTWPDVQQVLSDEQIKAIFPTANLGQPKICALGSYNIDDGGQTPKFAQCSWHLNDDKRMRITLRGIGADSAVVKSWDGIRTDYRKKKVEGDSFYQDGTYGARRVLLRQNGLGSFVVSDGEIAAWFDVQFPDSDFLVDDNAPETFKTVKTKAFPTMVETFVAFLPREH